MKKKKVWVVILWLAALMCLLLLADSAMRRDDGERKYSAFFADEQGFDVFFMGTSRMMDAIAPMELWRDYGVTSYNLANSSEVLDVTEQVLDLALDVHVPKVAMIDVFYVSHAVDEVWTYSYRHLFFDEVPLSYAKFEAVRATLPKDQWLEFMMPFSLYHGRWEEMLSGGVERMVECEPFMMGGELRAGHSVPREYERTNQMSESEQPGFDALRRIAALCRENGVEPVFVALPGFALKEEQMEMNAVTRVADELGVTFLNLFDVEGLVDPQQDCYDYLGHANPSGTSKVTAYIGKWLTENYALEDKRGQEAYAYWDENLARYEAYRDDVWGKDNP